MVATIKSLLHQLTPTMGGHANPHHKISSSDDRRRFPVSSSVEVRTDEKGLEGAYFSATVLPPPPPPPSPTSISPRKKLQNLIFVEYDNLLADDSGSERLREHIDASFVRPAPPSLQEVDANNPGIPKGFEPDDVADAFYKDGWWSGVVSRVAEGGKRVVVIFQNPRHELEFGLAELRAHWDWVDGIWVKKQSTRFISSMFEVGKYAEVTLNMDSWIAHAKIEQDLGNGAFLVHYDVGEDVGKRKRIDSHNIRPCPPLLLDDSKKFVLLEKVYAYYDHHWWSGVITKVLENRRYKVLFKKMKQVKEFEQCELRPHLEWKDGKWLLQPFSNDNGVGDQNYGNVKSVVDGKGLSRKQLTPPDNQIIGSLTKSGRRCSSDSGSALKKLKEGNVVQDRDDKPIKQVLCGSVNDMETSASAKTTRDRSSWEKNILRKQRSCRRAKQNVVTWKTERMLPRVDQKISLQEEMQRSSSVIDGEKQRDGDEGSGKPAAPALVDQCCMELNEPQILLPCAEKTIGVVLLDKDSEQQQSKTNSGMDFASALVDKCCIVSSETQKLPSVNNTASLREIVESMEIFQRIPQKPHFQPLEQFNESLREGLAIGYMVSFACLVEKTCRLQFSDPKSNIADIMETTAELERHGFDVSFVRDRLTKLLMMKEKEEKLVDKVNNFNNRISEQNHEKTRIEGEIGEIKEKMRKLQEKLSLVDDEIASLQAGLKETEESIKNVKCDFEGVVSSVL